MRAFVMTDLEGTAGVTSFTDEAYADARYLDRARHLATAELNAAVEGLVAMGVNDILVHDGHGVGGLCFEELHPAVRLLHGRPLAPRCYWDDIVDGYEVALMVGQHAMAGMRSGNMNHTQNSQAIDSISLNGTPIGEIAQLALYQGAAGMPLIFLSGEEAACREAEELVPRITTVPVKTGLGRNTAISHSAAEARRRISEGVQRSIDRHRRQPVEPLVWPGPYVLRKRFFHTDAADEAARHNGADRVDDQTVVFRGATIREVIYR